MGHLNVLFGSLIVGAIFLQTSYAISCYDCNSSTDKRCLGEDNKLPEELKKVCPPRQEKQYTLCRKIKQSIDFEVNGLKPDSRIIRMCGFEDSEYEERCYQRSGFGGRQEVCSCRADNCNGSTSITASISVVVVLLSLLKMYFD